MHIIEALPGVLGNRGLRPFIEGEQENKGTGKYKLKGTNQGNKGNFGEQ